MQIRAIYIDNFIPLGTQTLDLTEAWDGQIANKVLFNGPNGCGKSSLLRAIAALWEGFGYWLHMRKAPTQKDWSARAWLQQRGNIAIVLEAFPDTQQAIVLFFGTEPFIESLQEKLAKNAIFIGEQSNGAKNAKKLILPSDTELLDKWNRARQVMLASHNTTILPNMLFLDAEIRRWVTPKKGIGSVVPDDSTQRWLKTYAVSEQWEGQLEPSLVSMKATDPQRFESIIKDMNLFLSHKQILPTIQTGENRLRVENMTNGNVPSESYYIDELSAGEHQVLIQIYIISRWLETGGIVIIDEPDLHLHPALIPGFLKQLEIMLEKRQGQLLITSHVPEIWERYENHAKRFALKVI